jgi:hypothetical protein
MRRLDTVSALKVAGISRNAWNDILAHGIYTEAPKTAPGVVRNFDRDDLVALTVFHQCDSVVGRERAGLVASELRRELRRTKDDVETLLVCGHELCIGSLRRLIESTVSIKA